MLAKILPLLLGSGFCSLVYQTVWLREFRLIFGASTAANGAVLAIFMGGLGLGGWLLGKRADRHERPLLLYAHLEALIALAAAVSPLLLALVRTAYLALGGTETLGTVGATIVRLLLATLVLGVPTFLMGGTLPAVARAGQSNEDQGRHGLALLYGINTLGAVTGCLTATFMMLEVFGQQRSLWMACLLNGIVALLARRMALEAPTVPPVPEPADVVRAAPPRLILVAAALVGCVFLLMELVWYRMLGPILGGSVFTFGLVLAVALLGIGVGGGLYAMLGQRHQPTLRGFALTCLLEAACMAIPFALGDHLAVLAALLRNLNAWGFFGQILGWSVVTSVVVLPAALVSGFQFPLLMALLGRGGQQVGVQVGLVYAANTIGSMVGSLAGGFLLMPTLGAVGSWQLVAFLLVALGLTALFMAPEARRPSGFVPGVALAAVVALMVVSARGPTALWRHSGVGVGRMGLPGFASAAELERTTRATRRGLLWEADGVESNVSVRTPHGMVLLHNGKADGSIREDAPTQVMGGLLPALLMPQVRTALVVGLGTGTTSGWMADLPGMERVDVVELEPRIMEAAHFFAPVNKNAMENPRHHNHAGDAREFLLTSSQSYDIIFSEPSNPYRAGVASLFTTEFYRAVDKRLAQGGIFAQWVQGYEVDPSTVRTVVATVASVFPHVQMWRLHTKDIVLLASREPLDLDAATLRARIQQEPFKSGLLHAWRVTDLESVLARHLARPSLARAVYETEKELLNTDDQSHIEFAFAQTVGNALLTSGDVVLDVARARGEDRPEIRGEVDWGRVEDARVTMYISEHAVGPQPEGLSEPQLKRAFAQYEYQYGRYATALEHWRAQPQAPRGPTETMVVARSMAELGEDAAREHINTLRTFQPMEADVMEALLAFRQQRRADARTALLRALKAAHTDPWPIPTIQPVMLFLAGKLSGDDEAADMALLAELRQPLVGHIQDELRITTALEIAARRNQHALVAELFSTWEPDVPWERDMLELRLRSYKALGHPLLPRAEEDLTRFFSQHPSPFMQMAATP